MQFKFMPGKGAINAIFIVRRMQEEYQKKENKLYMGFVDLEKAFDRVPRKVMEWAMRKKSLSEVVVLAVMSLYDDAKAKSEVAVCIFREIQNKILCTSRICAVATIVCNSRGCYYRKCKECD